MTPIKLHYHVSPNEFVVHASAVGNPVRDSLSELGFVRALSNDPSLMLLHLTDADDGEPKAEWDRVRTLAGNQATVHPVLVDSDGASRYPLGTITVRFKTIGRKAARIRCPDTALPSFSTIRVVFF